GEKAALPVNVIEALRLRVRQVHHLHGDRLEPAIDEVLDDGAGLSGGDGIRFDDRKSPFLGHLSVLIAKAISTSHPFRRVSSPQRSRPLRAPRSSLSPCPCRRR